MNVNLSPAEIGVIVNALQSVYSENSPEVQFLAQQLCDSVYKVLGAEFYDLWVEEFELV